jgi:hypothetical protein
MAAWPSSQTPAPTDHSWFPECSLLIVIVNFLYFYGVRMFDKSTSLRHL